MKSIKLVISSLEHENSVSYGEEQILEDITHRLTLRKGDNIFDVTQGLDYDMVFSKKYETDSKIDHVISIILENKSVKDVSIIKFDQEERNLMIKFELLLEDNKTVEGGVGIGA